MRRFLAAFGAIAIAVAFLATAHVQAQNGLAGGPGNQIPNGSGNSSGGGAANPGGTNGQIQYNNSGVLGGFTASGDATINAGTGVVTLKNTGPGATGPLGTSTRVPQITIDDQGRVTALTDVAITQVVTPNTQAGTNYAFQSSDLGKIVYLSNAANQVPTIAQAGTGGFTTGWYVQVCNINSGTQTITPATSTIGGAATYVLAAGTVGTPKCVAIISDGTNYVLYSDGGVSLSGNNTWTGTNTFGPVVGTVTSQSGTTYTFASSDCGTTVRFTNASAVTATIPQGLAIGCNIAVLQAGAGQIAVNGSAVTPATLQSAHSYVRTFGAGAIIGLTVDTTNHVILTGDGAT